MKITLSFDIAPDELMEIGLKSVKGGRVPNELIEALERALKEDAERTNN